MAQDDPQGRKPYKTYKARGERRSQLDDELAGARPASPPAGRRPRPAAGPSGDGDPGEASGGDKGYRRYAAGPRQKDGRAVAAGSAPRGRRRFRWWHVPVGLLIGLIVAGVVLIVLAWPGYQRFDRAVDKANERLNPKTPAHLTDDEGLLLRRPTTVLLFGVDSKAGEPARSDTILLMRFIPGEHTINQLAIPRDTRVDIPGYGQDKINTAMFLGGSPLATQTVQDYLGIPINHVMVVDFKGFPRLVNAVGGVDMYVPKTVTTTAGSTGRTVEFKKGMHHFDGKYAMLYVRIRYADDDFHRARRQQQFLAALQAKIAQPSNITSLPEIGRRFMSGVATDLTTNELLQLGWVKWRADDGKGRKMVLAGEPAWIGGVSYVLPPGDAKKERMLTRFLGEQ
jgi:LCP family protein required for cell wall assembly